MDFGTSIKMNARNGWRKGFAYISQLANCATIVIHLEMLLAGTCRAVASAHPWERESISQIKLYAEASIYRAPPPLGPGPVII